MLVKSFGCSFIFGTDLPDQMGHRHSDLTWPAVFCQQQNHHYRCYARAGSGNLAIAESALSAIAQDHTALFIIGWTWIDRFDWVEPAVAHKAEWKTLRPVDRDAVTQTYFRHLQSDVRDKLTSLMAMRTVIDSLKQKQFPFIMTHMDDLIFDRTCNTTPAILALQDYVEPYITRFENQTFLNWSRSCGYAESANWHPLEDAHRAAADLILQTYNRQE